MIRHAVDPSVYQFVGFPVWVFIIAESGNGENGRFARIIVSSRGILAALV